MKKTFKRVLSLLMVLVLVCSVLPVSHVHAASEAYVKVTGADQFTSGQYVMIVSTGYAPSIYEGGWLTAVQPVVENDTVTDPQGAVWTLTVDGSSVIITDSNSTSIAPKTGNSNGIATGEYSWGWTFTDGTFQFAGTGSDTTTLASNTSSSNNFRSYKNATIAGNPTTYPSFFTLYKLQELPDEPECQHTNTSEVPETPATCTENGYTAGVYCNDCETYISGHEVIEAPGHNYVDGVCSVCGEKEPAKYEKVGISEIKSTDTVIIVSTKDTASYAMSNNNGTSAPAAVSVEIENGIITTDATNILWNIIYDNGNLTIYPAGETDTWLYCTATNNGVRVGTNTDNKIFTLDAETGYLKNTATNRYLGVYNNADWRCYTNTTGNTAGQTFSFYKLIVPECAHTNTVKKEAIAATCTTVGHEAGVFCEDCQTYISGGEIIPALGHSWGEGIVTTEATCTTEGVMTYTCATCGETKTEAIAANGHTFEVVGDDYVCSACDYSEPTAETLTIAEAIALANSMENYTFTVHKYSVTGVVTEVYNTKYGNMYITDGNGNTLTIYGTSSADGSVEYDKMDVKPAAGDTVTVYGVVGQYKGPEMKDVWLMEHTVKPVDQWNITLKDDLNVNFYMNLNADDQVQVTVGEEAVTYNAADLQTTEDGKYIVTVEMAAAQMMDAITIQIVGSNAAPETYTIRQYADTVLADGTKSAYHALVKDMLNYGAMAQVYFNHNAENLANAGIEGFGAAEVTEAAYETTIYEGTVDGISFYSASLVYGSKVAVRLYFKVLSGSIEDYTFSTVLPDAETGIEANVLTPVAKGDYYYIEFADITPDKWDEVVNLYVIKGEQNIHVQYSPLSYMARMSGKATSGDALKNLLKAMYNYHLAAKNLVVV